MAIFSPAMSSSMPTIASAVCWIGPTRWPATPLYDYAWLIFWAPWHPGLDAASVRRHAAAGHGDDLDKRLLAYQLQIALDTMQYQAFAGLADDLAATARHVRDLL